MSTSQKQPELVVRADPTKEFFIDMLVRDINLDEAIIDLVDNSVDGALRIRSAGTKKSLNLHGLKVDLSIDKNRFVISDNCGGIPLDLAKQYAFRFGRPPEARKWDVRNSVGQFGVGMKRALFKMGRHFRVESATRDSSFAMDIDVEQWQKELGEWIFHFEKPPDTKRQPESNIGSKITVDHLNEGVARDFALENFRTDLDRRIGETHQQNVERGLVIRLNDSDVKVSYAQLLASNKLRPAYRSDRLQAPQNGFVTTEMWAGIAEAEPRDGGWYVFCNGRMILRADQTRDTGWNTVVKMDKSLASKQNGGAGIPKYHNQFNRFRGYILFDSPDGRNLPWNTMKTGVDMDSPVFRATRLKMLTLMRPVITFLNKLKEETEQDENGPLNTEVKKQATPYKLRQVPHSSVFVYPSIRAKSTPRLGRISYQKPEDRIDKVRKQLGLKEQSNRRIGEETFDYYLRNEIGER